MAPRVGRSSRTVSTRSVHVIIDKVNGEDAVNLPAAETLQRRYAGVVARVEVSSCRGVVIATLQFKLAQFGIV